MLIWVEENEIAKSLQVYSPGTNSVGLHDGMDILSYLCFPDDCSKRVQNTLREKNTSF
jgi:hypothetical protein